MLSDTVDVGAVLDEALEEAIGRSHKKWALVLIAFVVGAAVGAICLIRRGQDVEPAIVAAVDAETT